MIFTGFEMRHFLYLARGRTYDLGQSQVKGDVG